MNDILTSTLDDMCELIVDCPHFTPEWTSTGFIVIRNQNIRDGKLDLADPSFTTREDFDRRIRRAKPQAGDIIFTREAPMGEVCMIPENLECCIGQRQVLLRPKKQINGRYLFFALRSEYVRHQIFWNEGTGSTVSNVRIPILEALKIPRMGDAEPGIAYVLGALDDKIALNEGMNETLQSMARAFFRDWFVDFGPVRSKLQGHSQYLADELWERFPDQLDGEGKPAGWKRNPFLKEAKLISGGTPKTEIAEYWNGDIPWASAKDVSQCAEPFLLNTERNISVAGLEKSATKMIPRLSTVVVARGATTGRYCMFGRDIAMNQTCYALHSEERPFWLNLTFSHLVGDLVHDAHGSVFDTITTRTFENASALIGDEPLMASFEETVAPLFLQILSNVEETTTLVQLRDLLLPGLISGELGLRDAKKQIEDAL